MHDLLVGYLLGEISDEQRQLVERNLRADPQLRAQLERVRKCLALEHEATDDSADPPDGLAKRTSDWVAEVADSGEYALVDPGQFSSLGFASSSLSSHETSGGGHWSVADLTVAAGVVLAVGMLLLPALRESRTAARRLECQNNLRQLGFALDQYSADNRLFLPLVQPNENAGIFAVRLLEGGYVQPAQINQWVVCPSSQLAEDVAAGRAVVRVPRMAELQNANPRQQAMLRKRMGGSYAYRFGYVQKGEYRGIRNAPCQSGEPVLADAPIGTLEDFKSCNHGGSGENILFQDQSVRYQKGVLNLDGQDHLFLNTIGRHAAGRSLGDAVLGRSEATPGFYSATEAATHPSSQ